MENLGHFYDHLVYITAIGNILWIFGIFCDNLAYFSPFWYFGPRKIWQPWPSSRPAQLAPRRNVGTNSRLNFFKKLPSGANPTSSSLRDCCLH
jgi:hypothetical protein